MGVQDAKGSRGNAVEVASNKEHAAIRREPVREALEERGLAVAVVAGVDVEEGGRPTLKDDVHPHGTPIGARGSRLGRGPESSGSGPGR